MIYTPIFDKAKTELQQPVAPRHDDIAPSPRVMSSLQPATQEKKYPKIKRRRSTEDFDLKRRFYQSQRNKGLSSQPATDSSLTATQACRGGGDERRGGAVLARGRSRRIQKGDGRACTQRASFCFFFVILFKRAVPRLSSHHLGICFGACMNPAKAR